MRSPGHLALLAVLLTSTLASAPAVCARTTTVDAPPATATSAIQAPDRIPEPPSTTIRPRVTAGWGALLLAAMFLLLYAYRRRTFVLQWTRGWFYIALAMAILARGTPGEPTRWQLAASGFLSIASAFTFLKAGASLRGVSHNTRTFRLLVLATLIWYGLARLFISRIAAFGAGFMLLAVLLALAGHQYYRLVRERKLLGAGVIAVMLGFVAVTNVIVAVSATSIAEEGRLALSVILFNSIAYVVTAFGMFVLVFEDITAELRETNRVLEGARDDLRQLAITDPLTGVYNRRYLEETFPRELQRHKRYNIPLSLLFVDVDHFKAINDRLGHQVGDRVLQHVAGFLERNVREVDYVFRWGGDEFLIMISCNAQEAARKAYELKQAFQVSLASRELPRSVGLSVGCTEVPPDTTDLTPLVRQADERMYLDKAASHGV